MPAGRQGFTLVELIVAVAIFSVVVTIIIGAFSMAIKAQKRVILLQDIQENAKSILEFMAKELRMSVISNTNDGLSTELDFTRNTSDGASVVYLFQNGQLLRNGKAMNSPNVNMTGSFYIQGVESGDKIQPRMTILLKLNDVTDSGIVIETQSTLCQRLLDFE